jgi:hypothetical protein
MISAHPPGQIAERVGPSGGQQYDEKTEADGQIANLKPAPDVVIAAGARVIGLESCILLQIILWQSHFLAFEVDFKVLAAPPKAAASENQTLFSIVETSPAPCKP